MWLRLTFEFVDANFEGWDPQSDTSQINYW